VRPTLLYGPTDILINNMAWSLRRVPVFGIPGDGTYRVQPVLVDDVADVCVRLGATDDPVEIDAAGPETRQVKYVIGRKTSYRCSSCRYGKFGQYVALRRIALGEGMIAPSG